MSLRHLGPIARNNRDVAIAAIRQNPAALQFATDSLKSDRGLVESVVRRCKYALMHASENLKTDELLVSLAAEAATARVEQLGQRAKGKASASATVSAPCSGASGKRASKPTRRRTSANGSWAATASSSNSWTTSSRVLPSTVPSAWNRATHGASPAAATSCARAAHRECPAAPRVEQRNLHGPMHERWRRCGSQNPSERKRIPLWDH